MKAVLAAAGLAAALACLAGCDGPADASPSEAGAAALSLPANMPIAPAGRWAYVQQIDGREAVRDERCRMSEDTLAEIAMLNTPPASGCSRSFSEKDGKWSMHMSCGGGSASITVDTTISGDFATRYDVEATRTSAPDADAYPSRKMTVHAERLGDC